MPNDAPPPPPGFFDYWLRGQDEAKVLAALAAAGIAAGPTDTSAYDPIGTIYDADENPIPGWHANLRMRHEITLTQYEAMAAVLISPPAHPVRVWA